MRTLIVTDIEGVHGVYDLRNMEQNREFLTSEVESCIMALHENNIMDITICDSHDLGNSISPKLLEKYDIACFSGFSSLILLEKEKYDFIILLGFHGMSGRESVLAHTLRPDVRRVWLENGVEIGEVEILCRWFGHLQIPIILVIGDEEAVREGNYFNPCRNGCIVKKEINSNQIGATKSVQNKIRTSLTDALNTNFSCCIEKDDIPVYIELYGDGNEISRIRPEQYVGNRVLRYSSCSALVRDAEFIMGKLNSILERRYRENFEFIKEMREIAQTVPRELVTDSDIIQLLKREYIWLNEDERRMLKKYLLTLKKTVEDSRIV